MFAGYSIKDFKKAVAEPSLVLHELIHKIDSNVYYPISNHLFDQKHTGRFDVTNLDWDNLFILDACRYDYFSEKVQIDGKLESKLSYATSSWPFMQKNFVGNQLYNTVYVTANLHAEKLTDDVFYTVETVPASDRNPENVVEKAKRVHDKYPNKRLIVHFMQPHRPYLGPTAERLREELDDAFLTHTASVQEGERHTKPKISFAAFRSGSIPLEFLYQMYEENLEIVLEHTNKLLNYIDGKSVITADHGELLGERKGLFRQRKFGHPTKFKTQETFTVPWFTIDSRERREIVAEEPLGFERLDNSVVETRLRELGYLESEI